MKEMHRPTFRPRNVDHSKPMQIIRDLGEFYKKEDSTSINWVKDPISDIKYDYKSILESEVKKIIELFDKKKTIVIPKVEESDKIPAQTTNEGKFSTHVVSYKQSEYIRPKHYIVYSERSRLEPNVKDYEASAVDLRFLKIEHMFISIEELEKIISALENDINKGEMIPNERVKEIILSIIPDKKQHIDKIIRFWHTRREEFKKSLVRKFWKDQKYTDKYLGTTFRRREREKMKTRRNKRNDLEGLQKLKEIRDSSQRYLVNMITMMKEREMTKKNILILQQLEFEAEANLHRSDKINVEEKYKEFIKTLPKQLKPMTFFSPDKKEDKDKENAGASKNKEMTISLLKNDLNQIGNIANEKTESSLNPIPEPQNKKPFPTNKRIRSRNTGDKLAEKSASTSNLMPKTLDHKKHEKEKKESEFILKHRIRFNRMNNLVIDRYIQNVGRSYNPFDDDFNKLINKIKYYSEDLVMNNSKDKDFENLYEDYLKDKYDGLILSDSEDDHSTVNTQVRSFSSSYKQFLKHKRSHPEISTV